MRLSKRLRKWKVNLTTQTPFEYILTLRSDVNGFADKAKALESENAKLKEGLEDVRQIMADELEKQVSDYRARHIEQARIIADLESENAKLRELVEAILQCAGEIKRDKGCDACPMYNGDEPEAFSSSRWCLLRPMLRELGIDVNV